MQMFGNFVNSFVVAQSKQSDIYYAVFYLFFDYLHTNCISEYDIFVYMYVFFLECVYLSIFRPLLYATIKG